MEGVLAVSDSVIPLTVVHLHGAPWVVETRYLPVKPLKPSSLEELLVRQMLGAAGASPADELSHRLDLKRLRDAIWAVSGLQLDDEASLDVSQVAGVIQLIGRAIRRGEGLEAFQAASDDVAPAFHVAPYPAPARPDLMCPGTEEFKLLARRTRGWHERHCVSWWRLGERRRAAASAATGAIRARVREARRLFNRTVGRIIARQEGLGRQASRHLDAYLDALLAAFLGAEADLGPPWSRITILFRTSLVGTLTRNAPPLPG